MGYHHTNVGCEEDPPVTCVIAVTETVFLSIIFLKPAGRENSIILQLVLFRNSFREFYDAVS